MNLLLLFVFDSAVAEMLEARGATKRRREITPPAVDVEDQIRAEFDPHFPEYVKQREQNQKNEDAALRNYLKEKQAYEKARELERQKYVKEFKDNKAQEEEKGELEHLRQQQAWDAQRDKEQQAYIKQQDQAAAKVEIEKAMRLQRAFSHSSERLPASTKK